ncbi:MAG: hypothetical protein KJO49_02245 [Bacteroidia bacterium]|nr:hypothetical protein [Bacteroidia bacterium]MBT8267917.1 hypothetical protein [Bacteroidia bacterium]NNF81116.1 hypothetical protein [Flavobacteriaceae bacterium]NNK71154.1 hypothetical protein [Flavobacteriaceae bacterium]NNL79404.1 hypothetical protein [Flavobacteriaceae bacterium]
MKHIIVLLALFIAQLVTAQEIDTNIHFLEDVKISFEMGSIDDLEVLDSQDLDSIFDYTRTDQSIELEIICNFDYQLDEMTISGTTLKIRGNSSELEEFKNKANKAKKALKNLYKLKE